ncbi:helix-turn-helix transcriptional regulator [Microbacterium sp. NPDC028030]|uniref:helix-turn-helix domain-containing protein n=1 Tax=Microbacterium sp. NPDC028030 TaxID=3155124 RepID=UPI0034033768
MLADMTNQVIGIPDKVRGVAAEKGYTQERTAMAAGISRTALVDRYAGRTSFKADEILALALAMRVRIERFFPSVEELADEDAA